MVTPTFLSPLPSCEHQNIQNLCYFFNDTENELPLAEHSDSHYNCHRQFRIGIRISKQIINVSYPKTQKLITATAVRLKR